MNDVSFYDVKLRKNVSVPASDVKKTKYERPTKDGGTQVRYALKAEKDGSKLTKFVSKNDWDALDAPVV